MIISLFKSQPQNHSNRRENPQQRRKHAGGNNHNKGQKEEQRQKAREQFNMGRWKQKGVTKTNTSRNKETSRPPQNRPITEILGLSQYFIQEELKKSYKIKASRFHSDKYAHMS